MKYLTIIRHAKSSWENNALADIDRPLNSRGKSAIKLIGKHLNENEIYPDLIISSPAKRAFETAIGISKCIKYDVKNITTEPVVYHQSYSEIQNLLKKLDNQFTDVFLIGHEPNLSAIIYLFTKKEIEKFPTCAICRIAFNCTKWKEIKNGTMVLFTTPKQLISFPY